MKNKIFKFLIYPALAIFALAGCNEEPCYEYIYPVHPEKEQEEYVPEVYSFDKLFDGQSKVELSSNENVSYNINQDLENKNYLQLFVKTQGNVKGKFVYSENDEPTNVVEEEFFIEPTENGNEATEFRQFLDAYRPETVGRNPHPMSVGAFEKTLKRIEFTNIENTAIDFQLMEVNISAREIPEEDKMVYMKKDGLKVGMDLLTGGTLSYLERYDYDGDTVDLVIDKDNNVQIDVDASSYPDSQVLSNHVNLINIYDAGRQIQQSYYASIGGYGADEESKKAKSNGDGGTQNGYTRNLSTTADPNGYYWPYNPVQGGDEVVNFSQVIDFRRSEDELYCKTRALDWASAASGQHGNPKENRVTKSYVENTFKIVNGLLYATNRFIDWNGFTDMDSIPAHNIEIPATYISHPLHVFTEYIGDEAFQENADGSLDRRPDFFKQRDDLGAWKNGGHHTDKHPEDWFAWTNDNEFGVGVYIPGATYYSSGRSLTAIGIDSKTDNGDYLNRGARASKMASTYLYNKEPANSDFDPAYVRNTCYTAPVVAVKMKEYIALEYKYVVAVDYVDEFRQMFKELHEDTSENSVKNFNTRGLRAWN